MLWRDDEDMGAVPRADGAVDACADPAAAAIPGGTPRFLLIGPYDPHGGEYTFLAPPLGVWRLAGFLRARGVEATVFDPNCCAAGPGMLSVSRRLP